MTYQLKNSPNSNFSDDKRDYLYFGGTSYLGLQTHPAYQKSLFDNIQQLGTNWGSSRISNVQLSVFDEFENHISSLCGIEDAICVSSGFLSGQILAGYFLDKGHKLLGAPNSHPAILHQQSEIFFSYEKLSLAIENSEQAGDERLVLFLDSIDFSGNNYPDFKNLRKLALENIILVIDDSHGLGLLGENGFGLFKSLEDIKCRELVVCGSLGKACATPCGIILGSSNRMTDLRNTEYYASASPPSPAALKNFMDSGSLIKTQLRRLRENIEIFKSLVCPLFPENPLNNHPVFSYSNPGLTRHLLNHGIITTNFPYPSESSQLVSKIVLSASHSEKDIRKLSEAINSFYSSN